MTGTTAVSAMSTPVATRNADPPQPSWVRVVYSRYGAMVGYAAAAAAIYVGWAGRADRNITAESGLGYALGILGGSLMLILLLYSLRKRVSFLRRFGATHHWFRGHMMLGIVGPVLILFHANFKLGDLNSKVAMYCTLLVAGSGIVGRYLYAGFHNGLYGRRASLQELVNRMQGSLATDGRASALLADVRAELTVLDQQVLTPPRSIMQTLIRPIVISWQTRRSYFRLMSGVRRKLIATAMVSNAVDQHADRLEESIRRHVREHLGQVRQVARFSAFERLFALWHVVHVPFFLMLVIAAIAHVIAVHLY